MARKAKFLALSKLDLSSGLFHKYGAEEKLCINLIAIHRSMKAINDDKYAVGDLRQNYLEDSQLTVLKFYSDILADECVVRTETVLLEVLKSSDHF